MSGQNSAMPTLNGVVQGVRGGEVLRNYIADTLGYTSLAGWDVGSGTLKRQELTLAYELQGMGIDWARSAGTRFKAVALNERDAGPYFTGRVRDEVLAEHPELEAVFTDVNFQYPGGESLADCGRRGHSQLLVAGRRQAERAKKEGGDILPVLAVSSEITIMGALALGEHGVIDNEHAWGYKVGNAQFFDTEINLETGRIAVLGTT